MPLHVRTLGAVLALCLAAPVAAQQEESEEGWSGKAAIGYLATSGNTDNSNLNTAAEVAYVTGNWSHLASASAINATENDDTTAEAYQLGWKSELQLNDTEYLFGQLRWRKDRFSAYDTQFSQTLGYGRRLVDRERHKLNGEVGIGARQSDLVDGTSEEEIIVRGAADYTWILSDTAEFTQELAVEAGGENTYLESITALRAQLVGQLALVASYKIQHNTEVVPGTEKTDTYTALSLEYGF